MHLNKSTWEACKVSVKNTKDRNHQLGWADFDKRFRGIFILFFFSFSSTSSCQKKALRMPFGFSVTTASLTEKLTLSIKISM